MGQRQRILYAVEAMGGGIFTYLATLANGLCEEFDITIAYGVRDETPENIGDYFDDRVKLTYVKNFHRSAGLRHNWLAAGELKQLIKQIKPDIIHLHSSIAGAVGRLFLPKKNVQMYYTPHGYSFFMKDIAPIKRIVFRFVEKICGLCECVTIACGESEWEKSKKVCKKTICILNGVETDRLDAVMKEEPKKNTPFTVYTSGRITYQKNPELFNEIAQKLPEIRFLWIGDGDMRDVLTSPNIEVTGWKESDEALRLSSQGDLFILTSRWEGLPLSLLEAMYMKKPCITTNIVGNKDIIFDGETGFLCEKPDAFVQKIQELKQGVDKQIIENAHNEVLKSHSDQSMCRLYAKLYRMGFNEFCREYQINHKGEVV